MSISFRPSIAYSLALAGVPTIYFTVAQLTYSAAVSGGPWPSEWYWNSVIAFLVGFGIIVVVRQPGPRLAWRLAFGGIYALLMLPTILFIHLLVACWNGDCF